MLMKFCTVDKEGCFGLQGDPRMLYQIMVFIRMNIINASSFALYKALIIGLRYSVCRRQFKTVEGSKGEERKLLDYQSHMYKFGPLLSKTYAMQITANYISMLHKESRNHVKEGNFKMLDQLHHYTSGLKSLYSQMAYDGIDLVRRNCGGAGYSAWSGLVQLFGDFSPVPTYEGDNTVMS